MTAAQGEDAPLCRDARLDSAAAQASPPPLTPVFMRGTVRDRGLPRPGGSPRGPNWACWSRTVLCSTAQLSNAP